MNNAESKNDNKDRSSDKILDINGVQHFTHYDENGDAYFTEYQINLIELSNGLPLDEYDASSDEDEDDQTDNK